MSETSRAEITASMNAALTDIEFSETHKLFTSVRATLLLLGEVKCRDLFKDYEETLWDYSKDEVADVVAGKLKKEDLKKGRMRTREKKDKFFAELSDVYMRL